jgi:hypothetical protein
VRKHIPRDPFERDKLELNEYNDLAGETVTIAYRKKFGNKIYLGIFRSDEEAYQAFRAGDFEVKDKEWLLKFIDKEAYESDDCYWVDVDPTPEVVEEISDALKCSVIEIGKHEDGRLILEIRK